MARIFKVTAYMVDANDYFNASCIKDEIQNIDDIIIKNVEVVVKDIGEWDDNHPLNYCNSPIEECKKYFEV